MGRPGLLARGQGPELPAFVGRRECARQPCCRLRPAVDALLKLPGRPGHLHGRQRPADDGRRQPHRHPRDQELRPRRPHRFLLHLQGGHRHPAAAQRHRHARVRLLRHAWHLHPRVRHVATVDAVRHRRRHVAAAAAASPHIPTLATLAPLAPLATLAGRTDPNVQSVELGSKRVL